MSTGATPASAPPATMKLLVDTGAQRVLFAEAGKDVVDFLIGLLTMPLGAADRLLAGRDGALGSIANVYASVQNMDAAFVQSAAARDALLLPDAAAPPSPSPSASASASASTGAAAESSFSFSEPAMNSIFTSALTPLFTPTAAPPFSTITAGFPIGALPMAPQPLPAPRPPPATNTGVKSRPGPGRALPLYLSRCDTCLAAGSGGFVKDAAKPYTVADDLTVTPASSASGVVAMLKSLGVRDLDAVEERTVTIGHEEALGILKAALHSENVLTDAFLAKRKKRPRISGDNDDTGSTSE